ncbi:Protein piccolo Aczonin Brain-derived HLMN protein Multidomain presynaptic cytomatrix protein [Channa argus]|uniref:Protein piccolo Aczonin Brain-derived HLMN protein Multidomain presynaptic cytomatrix protein n=1 Tax=Channa argus TaxID=215402 RepID=A0A6G1PNP8_CHAAH|nr:Protein piccolo Aczonin Brain-derived HLMN protein Multidomain presynaptic cytomatrix protein [Channa argus]
MKVHLVVPAAIIVSVVLLGIVKIRKTELDKAAKRGRFHDIKLRVTYDVLREYGSEKSEMENLLDKLKSDEKALMDEVNMLQSKADKSKGEVDICQGSQKSARDELAIVDTEFSNLKAEKDKEIASWKTEVEALKQKLAVKSTVCNFLKKGSQAAGKLCGTEVIEEAPKQEAKPEGSKQHQLNAEAPKQGDPKGEAPKPGEPQEEAPKGDAPKPGEPQAEAPKPGEPKAEAPKPGEPKAEAPKPGEPKAEAPKPGEPKPGEPKPGEPKPGEPKPGEPKPGAPKPGAPKQGEPQQHEPKPE